MPDCRLCGTTVAKLQDSHLIPRSAYKMSRSTSDSRPDQPAIKIDMFDNSASQSSKQFSTYLLCNDCEDRFSKYGEKHMGNLWATRTTFKLRDVLLSSPHLGPDYIDGAVLAPDIYQTLVYFAISIIWRGGVWPENIGHSTFLTEQEELHLRDFLMGRKNLNGTKLILNVNTNPDNNTNGVLTMPSSGEVPEGIVHVFTVPGIHFNIFLGETSSAVSDGFAELKSNMLIILEDFKFGNVHKALVENYPRLERRGNLKK